MRCHQKFIRYLQMLLLLSMHVNWMQVSGVAGRLKQAEKDAALYNSREALFGKPTTDYTEVKTLWDTFEPFQQFWSVAAAWQVDRVRIPLTTPTSYLHLAFCSIAPAAAIALHLVWQGGGKSSYTRLPDSVLLIPSSCAPGCVWPAYPWLRCQPGKDLAFLMHVGCSSGAPPGLAA